MQKWGTMGIGAADLVSNRVLFVETNTISPKGIKITILLSILKGLRVGWVRGGQGKNALVRRCGARSNGKMN